MKLITTFSLSIFTYFSFGQLTDSMIAYFPFSGNFNDASMYSIVGSNNGCTLGLDRFGSGNETMYNSTSTGYVSFNEPEVKRDFPLTISVWVKAVDFSAPNIIFSSDNIYENNYGYWLATQTTTGQIGLSYAAGLGGANTSNRRSFVTNEVLQIGVWHHIVAIIRGYNDMEVYIDCTKCTGNYSGTGSQTIGYSSSESRIGSNIGNNWNPNGNYFNGDIDQIAIWNRSLSSQEINTLCQQETTLSNEEIVLESSSFEVLLFPNPASDEVELEFNRTVDPIVEIYDALGKLVYSDELNDVATTSLNVSNLETGVYFVKVVVEDHYETIRFVKE